MPVNPSIVNIGLGEANVGSKLVSNSLMPESLSQVRANRDLARERVNQLNQNAALQNQALAQKLAEEPLLREIRQKAAAGDKLAQIQLFGMSPKEYIALKETTTKMSDLQMKQTAANNEKAANLIMTELAKPDLAPKAREQLMKTFALLATQQQMFKTLPENQVKTIGNDVAMVNTNPLAGGPNKQVLGQKAGDGSPTVNLTPEEQSAIGPVTGTKLSDKQEKIVRNMRRGMSKDDAIDKADGFISVKADPVSGEMMVVNDRTGQSRKATPEDIAIDAIDSGIPQQGQELAGEIKQASGVTASLTRGAAKIFGTLLPGVDPAVTAQNRVEIFNKSVEDIFVHNPRFPVAEVNRVLSLLPDVQSIFNDPEAQVDRLFNFRDFTRNQIKVINTRLQHNLSAKGRRELTDKKSDFQTVMDMLSDLPEKRQDLNKSFDRGAYESEINKAKSVEEINQIKKKYGVQ